ncbi:hypothetical protein TraAM80_05256 [Trypanosoma rangeli]|uniref:Uncharacterized protein n=1 Tax=Trypanosoma rangeli TaxID=5698 RepID=A0A3R7KZA1_TRYRA|nr:uncharacterized protein TraAM80_05256 [Trypanosoma rangeli]RNF04377.1 hypothetical protein TraAM80_05256 [Trypanosoma rangeli]|eukprot:RNF04377.1 hypothetical protein TraAM80_05256 [Trypanosoma rangeli]
MCFFYFAVTSIAFGCAFVDAVVACTLLFVFVVVEQPKEMLRVVRVLRGPGGGGWRSKPIGELDRRGRFNLDEAAAALELDPAYVAALYKPLHYTFAVRGQHYPAEQGRVSRPGSLSCSRSRMFPLYRRDNRLDAQLMRLSRHSVSTE